MSTAPHSWIIFDHGAGRSYVDRAWSTWVEAESERASLLLGHAPGSQWHVRLEVRRGIPTPQRRGRKA